MSLLRHRDFLLLWGGQTVGDAGTAISVVVLPLIAVLSLHSSTFQVGLLSAVEWLPWVLIGLPAGAWSDRRRSRPVLLSCDLVRVLSVGSVPLAAALGHLTFAHLLAAAFVTGVATVLFQVAYQSYLPALLSQAELAEGNAKLQGSGAAAQFAGGSLGGVLVGVLRPAFALIADAGSYLLSASALLAIRHREPPRTVSRRRLRTEIAEGVRYVRADPILRVLTISPAATNFFFTGYTAIVIVFLIRAVHVPPAATGLLLGSAAVGAVAGAALARPIGRVVGTSRAVWLVALASQPAGLLIPLTHRGAGLALFVVGNVVLYAGVLVYNVTIGSFRQMYCPPALLGRVVASMRFVLYGTIPLGAVAGGALGDAIGLRPALWVLLAGNVLAGLILLWSPLPRLRDLPAAAATAA